MELKPPQKGLEGALERNIELVEQSKLEIDLKLDLILLLLDKKQGTQLGDFEIAEQEEEKAKVFEKFTEELSEILKLLNSLKLQHKVVKELSDDNGIIGFSVLASKDESILNKFAQADKTHDDKAFGAILGYPPTAVETYGTDKVFDIHEELSPDELGKLQHEGVLPFLLFMPSRENWAQELEWARENQRLVKEKAPKFYQYLMQVNKA